MPPTKPPKPPNAKKRRITPKDARANYCTDPECRWVAWRLYAEGSFSWSALARGVNERQHRDNPKCPEGPHDEKWAERAVDYCAAATAEAIDRGGPASLAILLQGLQADQQAQLGFALKATQAIKIKVEDYGPTGKRTQTREEVVEVPDNMLRSLARTRVTDIRMKIAQALGVVTERKVHELTGADGGPIAIETEIEASERFHRYLNGIAERRRAVGGADGGGDDTGGVPAAS